MEQKKTIKQLVHIRNFNHKRRRNFLRQEYHRYVRLQGAKWRKPRGMHSKLRLQLGNRQRVKIGYGTDRRVRGFSREGKPFRYIQGVPDVEKICSGEELIFSSRIGKKLKGVIVELIEKRMKTIEEK